MKIIDLLNKIANGEIENNTIFYVKGDFFYDLIVIDEKLYVINSMTKQLELLESKYIGRFIRDDVELAILKEVEILEEEKKEIKPLTKKDIEALGYACGEIQKCFTNGWNKSLKNKPLEEEKKIPEKLDLILDEQFTNDELQAYIYETQVKINEIIDYLKSKGE